MKTILFIPFLFMCSMVIGQSSKIIGKPYRLSKIKVAQYDFPKQMTWYDAKKACANLGNGWRLPTKDELILLLKNKDKIGGFASSNCGCNYWSSTEYDGGSAWYCSFGGGYAGYGNKTNPYHVRAVRAF